MRKLKNGFLVVSASLLGVSLCYGKTPTNNIEVISPSNHDVSKPLREIAQSHANKTAKISKTVKPLKSTELAHKTNIPIGFFQGLGQGFPNYVVRYVTPDANGAAGVNQYVQWVNLDLAVFNKQTGKAEPGYPIPGNLLWQGFGGPCERRNVGHPIVKYDQLAGRWVLTQQAYDDAFYGPFYQCVAVSKTENASGSYDRYAFQFDSYNDVGKLGLWPDGYYMSFNMKGPFAFGPRVCVLDRTNMLSGLPATMQCRQFAPFEEQIQPLPADLDGTRLPPAKTPGYFVNRDPDLINLQIYRFHVDFNDSFNSFIIGPFKIIDPVSSGVFAKQPNTNTPLETQFDSLMNRVAYRQFNTFGSMLLSSTTNGGNFATFHWDELRCLNNEVVPILYQSGNYAPDSKDRFISSIAMDKRGNIAVGYNVSSTAIYPSIEMAYRRSFDTLNTLPFLQALITGTGSQIGTSKWGTYSAMVMDPVDDCTFWYTNEYLKTTDSFNWSTAILSFKIPGCT